MSLREPHRPADAADLLHRIEVLERKLQRKTEALDSVNEAFQSLIYAVTHDFRAPLRAILSSSMILKEDFGEALGPEGMMELERQEGNVHKLNGLLEELLKIARLGRHEFRSQQIDLASVARQAAEEVGSAAAQALDAEEGVYLIGDPDLLRSALQQAMHNATKFADPDRPLRISVGKSERGYFVRDNGIGFDPSRGERIFLPFERVHGDEYPGAGIGLAIFKRIIDRHGGTVGFDSEPGEGTTIWFLLEE